MWKSQFKLLKAITFKISATTVVFIYCLYFGCCTANAAVFYVSPTGRDSASGREAETFKTLQKAVDKAAAGDTIILKDGHYGNERHISDGSGCLRGCNAAVTISKAAHAGNWITVKAEHKWKAVLDCGTENESSLGCDMYVYLKRSAAYWSFEDLVVTRGAFGGITTNEGASHIQIKGCRFENIGNFRTSSSIGITGIGFGQDSVDWLVDGNVIHDVGRTDGLHRLNHDHGIYAGGTDARITNNLFYNNKRGWAIQTTHGAHHWLIANNTFAFSGNDGDGHIVLWDGEVPGSIGDIIIRNNIFYGDGKSAIVTVVTLATRSIPRCLIEHNLTNAAKIYDGRRECTLDDNQTGVDPKFVNSTTPPFDFHLRSGSPALGLAKGALDIQQDLDGRRRPESNFDAGAYQWKGIDR